MSDQQNPPDGPPSRPAGPGDPNPGQGYGGEPGAPNTAPIPQQPAAGQPTAPYQPYAGWHQPPTGRPAPPPYATGQAQQPAGPSTATTGPRRRSRAAVPVAALLAAILASGGTYALTHPDGSSAAVSGGSTTVVKADPANFGSAGQVNWAATASKVTPSVVSITVVKGNQGDEGSGVILDTKGDIVTNNHVVSLVGKGGQVQVTLNNNDTYQAQVIGTDSSTDLAVVRLENPPKNLKPITMGSDHNLVVGQPVMAVGNPLGLSGTVTTGIVSALNRPVTTQEQPQDGSGNGGVNPFGFGSQSQQPTQSVTTNAIQTSAAINPGNSGGALVSGSGKLIGINSSIATLGQSSGSSQSGNIGIGFAIPVTVVKQITGELISSGKASHAQIGISVQTTQVKVDGAVKRAAKVVQVNSGSAASKAGLRKGDVIIAMGGNDVVSSSSLVGYVREKAPGDKITLTILRGGHTKNVTVTLGSDGSHT